MDDLLLGESFLVSYVLDVHLDNLKGLSAVPVQGRARLALTSLDRWEPMLVTTQYMADGGPGQLKLFILFLSRWLDAWGQNVS